MEASRKAREQDQRRQREFEESKRREAEARAQRAEDARQAAEAARQVAAALAAKEQELRAAQERIAEEERQRAKATRLRLKNDLQQQAWRTQLAIAAAVVGLILTALATGGLLYAFNQKERADEALIEANAGAFWNGLQLWRDPLTPQEVATLWDLAEQDEEIRVAFVRQLADDPALLSRFGYKPQPIARAVGLRWPEDARQIAKQSMAYVASGQFHPTDPFELVSYTRALAALTRLLDAEVEDSVKQNIEGAKQNIQIAINGIAGQEQLSDQQLWTLPDMVEVGATIQPPIAIQPANDRLRAIIRSAEPTADAGWRGQAIGRAIGVMAKFLNPSERLQAIRYLVPMLGQNARLRFRQSRPARLDGPAAEP